ncbi:MAG: PhoH family protein [Halothiobacillaceae bacterium]|nr:PhoH family protein [Halothiobacillaceae bacterium]HER35772.1 PhoH family protein [Halothiobacillaceae bacterium]
MIATTRKNHCLFVLDTNVLMHDPTALYRFMEHDIYLPMIVLEELDAGKKGQSETARNVRQVSRFLDEMLADIDIGTLDQGLPVQTALRGQGEQPAAPTGRLFLQTHEEKSELPVSLPGNRADNQILGITLALKERISDREVILVSKDINLRIKATAVGLKAEDYHNDQVLDDVSLLHTGYEILGPDFWEAHGQSLESWQAEDRVYYRVRGADTDEWYPNLYLRLEAPAPFTAVVREVHDDGTAVLESITNFEQERHSVWGITARNPEQSFALNALMDPSIDFVSLLGQAGTGKTLLTLAAALTQVLEHKQFTEIVMTRVTIPVGEDIGYLPGTEEEKMTPWMGALMDNLEVLAKTDGGGGSWERAATNDLLQSRIKIRSLNFMRGRTFQNKFVIIDEAQNLTAKQMRTLITRAGPGTKMVCLGNVAQIDTPYLTETSSGLTFVVDRFRGWGHGAHVTLARGERSRLAEFAAEVL